MRQRLVCTTAVFYVLAAYCAAQEPRTLSLMAPDSSHVPERRALPERNIQDWPQQNSARFTFIGVKRAEDCGPALQAMVAELKTLEYPAEWRFKIACNPLLWDRVQRKIDRMDATFAISELKHKFTILNAAVFRLDRYVYRRTLSHELGHIRCGCKDEEVAEKWAKMLETGLRVSADSAQRAMLTK
jgi:hypothetical protein